MASKPKSNLTPIQQRSYKDIQRELENMPNPFLALVSKKDQKKITIATM